MELDKITALDDEREKLKRDIYSVINAWVAKQSSSEPEIVVAVALEAVLSAGADMTASYRFTNRFSQEWTDVCCSIATKMFENSHYAHLKELKDAHGTEDHITLN